MSASQWRTVLSNHLRGCSQFFSPVEVKLLINVFLNTSAENAISLIKSKTLFPPQVVLQFFRQLEEHRPTIISKAEHLGCDLSFTTNKNVAFFALEYLEQRVLRHFLFELSKLCDLTSIVMVHDGIYFSPPAPAETVQLAASLAAGLLTMPPLEMKYINLQQEWHRTYGYWNAFNPLPHAQRKGASALRFALPFQLHSHRKPLSPFALLNEN